MESTVHFTTTSQDTQPSIGTAEELLGHHQALRQDARNNQARARGSTMTSKFFAFGKPSAEMAFERKGLVFTIPVARIFQGLGQK